MTLLNWGDLKILSFPTDEGMQYRHVENCLDHITKDDRKYLYIAWLMGLAVRPTRDFDRRVYKFR